MISDAKKVQTAINRLDELNVRDDMIDLRDRFVAHNPDVTGTPLEGNKAAVNNAMQAVIDAFDAHAAVWTGINQNVVPTHRGEAMP